MADDFDSLKKACEELLNSVKVGGELEQSQKSFTDEVTKRAEKLREDINNLMNTKLSSQGQWDQASKEDKENTINAVREDLPSRIRSVRDALNPFDTAKKEAWALTCIGVVLLILLSGLYLYLHSSNKRHFYDAQAEDTFFVAIGTVKGVLTKQNVNLNDVVQALPSQDFLKSSEDLLVSEFRERINLIRGQAQALSSPGRSPASQGDNTTGTPKVKPPGKAKPDERKKPVPVPEPLLGQNDSTVKELKGEIEKIEKEAKSLSGAAGFFWVAGYWKWLEIVLWGEFGVIIGILSWIGLKVESAEFTKQRFQKEIYWYLLEVFIGPIVVVAAFFLLKQFIGTLLQGFTEEEVKGSIYVTLGISFVLGLFIRRTLGIFDLVKNTLPLPKS